MLKTAIILSLFILSSLTSLSETNEPEFIDYQIRFSSETSSTIQRLCKELKKSPYELFSESGIQLRSQESISVDYEKRVIELHTSKSSAEWATMVIGKIMYDIELKKVPYETIKSYFQDDLTSDGSIKSR